MQRPSPHPKAPFTFLAFPGQLKGKDSTCAAFIFQVWSGRKNGGWGTGGGSHSGHIVALVTLVPLVTSWLGPVCSLSFHLATYMFSPPFEGSKNYQHLEFRLFNHVVESFACELMTSRSLPHSYFRLPSLFSSYFGPWEQKLCLLLFYCSASA